METDVAVLAERRAKMARLRSEHFVAGRDVTSAPRVTRVDEFSQVRGALHGIGKSKLRQKRMISYDIDFSTVFGSPIYLRNFCEEIFNAK